MASQFGFVSNDDFIEKMDELIDALPHSGATGEVTGVKGNAESAYRVGNVNLTPANIGLGNVNNTSDANKPISTATQTALNNKADKNGNNIIDPTAFRKAIGTGNQVTLTGAVTGTGTFDSNGNVASINTTLNSTLLGQIGYNLLEMTTSTQTINGVTFTVDKATGTVTANGTASDNCALLLNTSTALRDKLYNIGDIVLSGCTNGSRTTYDLRVWNARYNSSADANFSGETALSFTNNSASWNVAILIRSGVTVSNLVFKPMLVPAELAGVPFQPYAKSNVELTSGKLDATGNEGKPYDNLPDHFELWTSPGPASSNGNLWIKMKSYSTSVDSFLLLGNDDTLQYFGIEKDNFVVQTKDANSMYEFKDDGIYLNGTRIAP